MVEKNSRVPPLRRRFNEVAEQRRLAQNTRKAYAHWIAEFVRFFHPRNPESLREEDLAAFITYLVNRRAVSSSTQHLAFNAVIFFFRYVVGRKIGKVPHIPRALRRNRKNYALTEDEVRAVVSQVAKKEQLLFLLMYGCGLRISEACRLVMKDIAINDELIYIREAKSGSDRAIRVPGTLLDPLQQQMQLRWSEEFERIRRLRPTLPTYDVERTLKSFWDKEYLFVSQRGYYDEQQRRTRRCAISPSRLQKSFKVACALAGIRKMATPHALRYSYASNASYKGSNLAELQLALGHKDPNTTARYIDCTKVVRSIPSPLDSLFAASDFTSEMECPRTSPSKDFAVTQVTNRRSVKSALKQIGGALQKLLRRN